MRLDDFARRIAAQTLLELDRLHFPVPPDLRRKAVARATSPERQKAILTEGTDDG